MEHNNGVSNINGHALSPLSPPSFQAATTHPFLSPNQMRQQMHHQVEEEEEEEKRKKMKLKSSANWLGLADNTYHHFSTKDITPSFPNTTTMDHPFLQLHPYHHHYYHQQQSLPEMAIAKSSLSWQLGSNIRGEDNQSRINLTQDGSESLINFVSAVDGGGGGGAQKWYNNSPEEEWERRVGLRSNPHMWDPTGLLSCNNIQQSFLNYTGNSSNTNNNTPVMKGGGSSSSSSNNKDRHSKVFTAKGVRDRRIRLAVSTATQFYDIQDRLGFEQPSKAVDWLMSKARASIDQLPRMEPYSTLLSRHSTASIDLPICTATLKSNSDASHQYSTTHQIQDLSGKSHAEEEQEEEEEKEEEQAIKVVPGVEMRLADDTSPPLSLISIRRTIDIAAASFSYSSLPSSRLQEREDSLRLCRSDRH